ncbi:MAG TPA: DNA translocase FtsK 4TM domain-containing protein, partial [Candidatus Limnocylindrales bacterium]|nr:DNA translocase FtsK 4TM domain-containing protein [Candidatus Limnocylindrales bacterium]
MAKPRRSAAPRSASRSPRRRISRDLARIFTPEVVRSIVGTAMMALGAITLIALILPGQGALTDWWRDSIAPWFETGRWLLPFLLLGGGWYVAGGPGRQPGSGWGMTLAGLGLAYVAALGAFEVLKIELFNAERGGGRIGRFLAGTLEPLLTGPGTFVLLAAIAGLGLMLAFNLQLRELFSPLTGAARWLGSTTAASMRRATEARPTKPTAPPTNGRRREAPAKVPVPVPMATGGALAAARSILDEPAPLHSQSPVSQTVWTGPLDGGSGG